MKDVISETLETMFFAMVDFEEGDAARQPFDYGSRICIYNHDGRMEISFRVSRGFAKMITANLLGVDEEDVTEDDLEDSLREFSNIVGGGYHARIKSAQWRLGIPTAWKVAPGESTDSRTGETEMLFHCFGEPMGAVVLEYLPDPNPCS